MTERTKGMLWCGVMLVVQTVVAWAVFLSSWCMRRIWSEILLGGEPLPAGTGVALALGYAIPSFGAIACAAVLTLVLLRRDIRAADWLMVTAVVEIIAMALFAVGVTEPAMFMTSRLGR